MLLVTGGLNMERANLDSTELLDYSNIGPGWRQVLYQKFRRLFLVVWRAAVFCQAKSTLGPNIMGQGYLHNKPDYFGKHNMYF